MATKKAVKTKVKSSSISKPFSKSELVAALADSTGLVKKQVVATLETLEQIIKSHITKKGPGVFVFPGVAKFHVVRKLATKARKGTNPFTGEPMTFAAKPARNIVRIKALKKLKDIAK